MVRIYALIPVLLATPVIPAAESDRNLALGRPAVFAPSPDYPLTSAGGTDATDLHFWSGRLWDTELLAAYSRAIRNVAPVEDIIVDGELLAGAAAEPAARISGMRRDDQMLLLVADYWKPPGTKMVTVTVPVDVESRITDLDTGRAVAVIKPDQNSFTVGLDRELARIFHVRPSE